MSDDSSTGQGSSPAKWLLLFRPAAIAPRITGNEPLIHPVALFALLTTLTTLLGQQLSTQTFAAAGLALPPRSLWTYYLNLIIWPLIPAVEALAFDLVASRMFGLRSALRRLTRLFYYVAVGTTAILLVFTLIGFAITDLKQPLSGLGILIALAGAGLGLYCSLVGLYLVKGNYQIGYGIALQIAILGHVVFLLGLGLPSLIILVSFLN